MAYRDSGAAQANSAPLPRSLQIGWAFGTAGSTTILYIINIMFLYFMVAHLGIAPAVAGSLLLFARIYDAVADLFIGTLSDRTRSRWGRRRPWMAVGTAMATLGMAMTFLPQFVPDWIGPQGQITIILVLLFTGYSAYSIPASAMATEMTTDYQGRTTLMAYRTFFIQVSTLVAVAGAPALVAMGGGTTQAYLKMGIVMAAFIAISMGTAVAMTAGAPDTQRTQREMPGWERITSMFANRPFLVLLAIKFCGYISTAAAGAAGLFFMRDVIQRGEAGMSAMGLFSAIAGMATVPLWRWIARFGRKEYVCIAAMVCTLLVNLSWLAATPQESDAIFYLRGVFTGLSATGALMMMLAMLPDAIEHDFHRTGLRREGVYAAIFEFFQKAAFAIGPFFVGLFLTASGYKASTGAMFSQGAEAIHAVRLTMSVLPAACTAISIFLLLFCYRLPPRQG